MKRFQIKFTFILALFFVFSMIYVNMYVKSHDKIQDSVKDFDTVFRKTNNSISNFYTNYFGNGYTSGKEKMVLDQFDFNNVVYDFTISSLTLDQTSTASFFARAINDDGVEKIEWYYDETLVKTTLGYAKTISDTYTVTDPVDGYHKIAVVAYDLARVIDSSVIPSTSTANCRSSAMIFLVNTAIAFAPTPVEEQNIIVDELTANILSKISEDYDYLGTLRSPDGTKTFNNSLNITLKGDMDLILRGLVFGAFDSLGVYNSNNKLVAKTYSLHSNEEFRISGLPQDNYTVTLNLYDGLEVSFAIVASACPTTPVLDIPEHIDKRFISIANLYGSMLYILVGESEFKIAPHSKKYIPLNEGLNNISYFLSDVCRDSEANSCTVYVDTKAPELNVIYSFIRDNDIFINLTIDEYPSSLMINGTNVSVGEYVYQDEIYAFTYVVSSAFLRTNFIVEATDKVGNYTKKIFDILLLDIVQW